MASVPCTYSVKIIYVLLTIIGITFGKLDSFVTHFDQIKVINITKNEDVTVTKVQFQVFGRNIQRLPIKSTKNKEERGVQCIHDLNYNITEVHANNSAAEYILTVPPNVYGDFYLCVPQFYNNTKNDERHQFDTFSIQEGLHRWYHQGPEIVLRIHKDNNYDHHRGPRDVLSNRTLVVTSLRLEEHYKDVEYSETGVPKVIADQEHIIRLFGEGFVPEMTVAFTTHAEKPGDVCQFPVDREFPIQNSTFSQYTARVVIKLPPLKPEADSYYVCIKPDNRTTLQHQGSEEWLQIISYEDLLPVWAKIVIICFCLTFSALFSGLNLGLMSMDQTELKIFCNTGTSQERKYARAIQPVRSHGNYLLCSILLGNVFVNSIFTILLDSLTTGWVAVIFSTIAIVLIGEIIPQAICSKHGLLVGAKTIYITKFIMMLTFPMSYPVSKFLDCILGEEISNVYNRERLKELVKVTTGENDLDKDEVNIISGALELRRKTVADVMTKIEDVFMLDYEAVLDFETVSEIMKSGYSRVPVFEGTRQNIVTMLYIKDLAFVDPDDNTKLKTLCQFYQNSCNFVFEDVKLDVMFRIFKEGNKGHMAFVHRVNSEGEGDPFYETVGLITLEDVIEELIQAEIMDETDVFTDNRNKRKRNADRRQDFSVFAERRGEGSKITISPQLTLATFQFLSTSIEQFVPSIISETILKRLLKQDIIYHIKKNKDWRTDPASVIYSQGKNSDYFVLILEGRVEVTIGKESLMFEGGPFTFFGTQALIQNVGVAESPLAAQSTALGSLESLNLDAILRHTFQPDYTVRASTEVIYLKIKRQLYLAAKRATLMERAQKDNPQSEYDDEFDKYLHSMDDEEDASGGKTTPIRKRSTKSLVHPPDQLSPKSSTILVNVNTPRRIASRDLVNGSIISSPIEDNNTDRGEAASLLSETS